MPTDRIHPRRGDAPDMSAEMIAGRRFAQSWRGYDTDEVTQFLAQVAAQVRAWREKCDQAEAARREAEQRASHPEMDEATLMAAVGEETASILRSARSAAAEITAKAQANAAAAVAEAEARAAELVAQSESVLAARTAEAEAAAAQISEEALAEAAKTRLGAQQQADAMAEDAARESAETVHAAQQVREKILTDLARRRKLGSVQVEQLRAGRERLLDAYLVVRRTLEEVTDELQRADAEARAAADAAGRQHGVDADELVDLRSEDAWRPVSQISETRLSTPGRKATTDLAETPMVPKGQAAPLPSPAALNGDKHPGPSVVDKVADKADTGASAVVSRTDAIESVRILRQEPAIAAAIGPDTAMGPEAMGAPTAAEAVSPEAEQPAGAAQSDVQGLFARLRASRAEATSSARKALYDVDLETAAGEAAVDAKAVGATGDSVAGTAPVLGTSDELVTAEESDKAAPANVTEDFLERRDQIVLRLESSLARKLKRALQDEQNSLLDRLRGLKAPVKPADVLPNMEEQPDRFVDAGRPVLEEAFHAGCNLVTSLFGGEGGGGAPERPEVIDTLAEELGRSIAEPLRQRLEQAFESSNEDPTDLAEALGPAYREWKTQRIEAAARDQVEAAFARGAYLAFPAQAVLVWVSGPSRSACPDCEDNALAGPQAKGETWPTGQLHPPAHPGCRCALAPEGAAAPQPAAVGASAGTSAS